MEVSMKLCGEDGHVLEIDGCGGDSLTIRIDEGPWFTLDRDDSVNLVKFLASFGGHD